MASAAFGKKNPAVAAHVSAFNSLPYVNTGIHKGDLDW